MQISAFFAEYLLMFSNIAECASIAIRLTLLPQNDHPKIISGEADISMQTLRRSS